MRCVYRSSLEFTLCFLLSFSFKLIILFSPSSWYLNKIHLIKRKKAFLVLKNHLHLVRHGWNNFSTGFALQTTWNYPDDNVEKLSKIWSNNRIPVRKWFLFVLIFPCKKGTYQTKKSRIFALSWFQFFFTDMHVCLVKKIDRKWIEYKSPG